MAVVFELVAGFGDDQEAAARAAATVPGSLQVGTRTVALHRPLLSGGALSVIPVGVSQATTYHRRRSVTSRYGCTSTGRSRCRIRTASSACPALPFYRWAPTKTGP